MVEDDKKTNVAATVQKYQRQRIGGYVFADIIQKLYNRHPGWTDTDILATALKFFLEEGDASIEKIQLPKASRAKSVDVRVSKPAIPPKPVEKIRDPDWDTEDEEDF